MSKKDYFNSRNIIDDLIDNRKNYNNNNDYAPGTLRTCVNDAICDAAITLGEYNHFFKRLVEEKDLDWIIKGIMVARYKPEAMDQLKNNFKEIGIGLYKLHEELAAEGKLDESQRILDIFDGMPISPEYIKAKVQSN
ncbi:hypothetical protein ACFL1H_04170 [Nanoarchaeota archaeon]